ncbi:uncharacterized protein LOC109842540 [Asparagus officinalis]|uniref:uncharacterized protein LOC109842540 n=1 Tax=Asparagus officinalis TaxID=4686 RepID=UPI00098E13F0|nr:uncharacterized protein LOC109842540 [Asparagus officinalis]
MYSKISVCALANLIIGKQCSLFVHSILIGCSKEHVIVLELQVDYLVVQSALAFLCLSTFFRKYGLRRFLFLDKLRGESRRVRLGYASELNRSFRILAFFVTPCFVAECGYKIWWYYSGARRIPFLGNAIASDMAACALEIASWLYRTSMFLLVCVIFRVICYLQILRLQDFATVFQEESDAAAVLQVHLKIRRQLRVISHRFRKFIVAVVILVTGSQFATILLTTRPRAEVNVFNNGEIALCSVVLVTGLLITVSSAVKITHKAQAVTSLAAKWHACATIDSFDADLEAALTCEIVSSDCVVPVNVSVENDQEPEEVEGTDEDDLESMEIVQPHAHSISFQKRQALVTYLENNRAGITVYGFMLDRTCLHMVFMVELSLFLWLLGKTIGIS